MSQKHAVVAGKVDVNNFNVNHFINKYNVNHKYIHRSGMSGPLGITRSTALSRLDPSIELNLKNTWQRCIGNVQDI